MFSSPERLQETQLGALRVPSGGFIYLSPARDTRLGAPFMRGLSRVETSRTRWLKDALTLRIAIEVDKATRLSPKTKETQLRVPTT